MKRIVTYFLVLFIGVSCGNKWKKTTGCTMVLTCQPSNTHVTIQSIEIPFQSIVYEGKRTKGADVAFTASIEQKSILSPSGSFSQRYDMPQGFYQTIDLQYKIHENMTVKGVIYDANDDESIRFTFILNESHTFYAQATDIQISIDKNYTYLSNLHPEKWFTTLNVKELELGDYYYDNEVQDFVLEMSATHNTGFYQVVKKAIETQIDLTVK
jgi:hypothetical protein